MNFIESICREAMRDGTVMRIAVMVSVPGVALPSNVEHANPGIVVLDIGTGQPIPIPDLVLGPAGISATLSFGREPHACYIPWESICAITSARIVAYLPIHIPQQDAPEPTAPPVLRLVN